MIPVLAAEFLKTEQKVFSARELYDFLGLHSANWKRWYENNITKNKFAIQGEDYSLIPGMRTPNGGQPSVDFAITLDFAKRIAIATKTPKGEEARQYFLRVEKYFRESDDIFTGDEVIIIVQMRSLFIYIENQIEAENLHEAHYLTENSKSPTAYIEFHQWRNKMLGIDKVVLDAKVKQYCEEHNLPLKKRNKREKIMLFDSYETVRHAVWDFLSIKGDYNADKISKFVKKLCEREGVQLLRKNEDTLFDKKEELPELKKMLNGGGNHFHEAMKKIVKKKPMKK